MLEIKRPLFSDTIAALCTPQGNGALALIRVSGPEAWAICSNFIQLRSGKLLQEINSHTVHNAYIISPTQNERIVDNVMVLALKGPRTFTGYDTIEITAHNNTLIIQEILELTLYYGARSAQHGEFTRQAYDNKKVDLLQAEAINELISAQTQEALKKSLSQLHGSLSSAMATIEDTLCKSIAWCESSFEFLDDEGDFHEEIRGFLAGLVESINSILSGYAAQRQIRNGYRVALIGCVNAGKSSLFNLLIGHKRAIVTPIAGTTRDSIENMVILAGSTATLIDTAGLRTTHDVIEQEGIERSYDAAHASDIILLVIDGSRIATDHEQKIYQDLIARYQGKIIFIQSKADIASAIHNFFTQRNISPLLVSAQDTEKKELIEAQIIKKISTLAEQHQLPFLINKRHYELLQSVLHDITHIQNMLLKSGSSPHYELISYHLKQSLECMSEITGKSVSEAALDRVFKEFCVGK